MQQWVGLIFVLILVFFLLPIGTTVLVEFTLCSFFFISGRALLPMYCYGPLSVARITNSLNGGMKTDPSGSD
jgi:hypothetical protein